MGVVHTADRLRKGREYSFRLGSWICYVSDLYNSDVDPAGLGPISVQNTKTLYDFFRTGFPSSVIK